MHACMSAGLRKPSTHVKDIVYTEAVQMEMAMRCEYCARALLSSQYRKNNRHQPLSGQQSQAPDFLWPRSLLAACTLYCMRIGSACLSTSMTHEMANHIPALYMWGISRKESLLRQAG